VSFSNPAWQARFPGRDRDEMDVVGHQTPSEILDAESPPPDQRGTRCGTSSDQPESPRSCGETSKALAEARVRSLFLTFAFLSYPPGDNADG
jgi:hypothetical protein